MKNITFKDRMGITIGGLLQFPENFNEKATYPAIISVPPAGGIKEQTAGLYAEKLAKLGYVTLAIDAPFQGDSDGEIRYQESPYVRIEDIRSAVDFLVTLPYVDEERIGLLGICAGGGYAMSATMTERRIKALGLVVPVNGGREMRQAGPKAMLETLEMVAKQRTAEARGQEPMIVPWFPEEYKDAEEIDDREAYDYYLNRGYNEKWPNKMRFTSMDAVLSYDSFDQAEILLTQPLQVIVGDIIGSNGSYYDGQEIFNRAASKKKDFFIIEGASHFELYDKEKYVSQAIKKLEEFYKDNL